MKNSIFVILSLCAFMDTQAMRKEKKDRTIDPETCLFEPRPKAIPNKSFNEAPGTLPKSRMPFVKSLSTKLSKIIPSLHDPIAQNGSDTKKQKFSPRTCQNGKKEKSRHSFDEMVKMQVAESRRLTNPEQIAHAHNLEFCSNKVIILSAAK